MIVGITPARGGSKGIPRKNIYPLCGKPLIAWTIDDAKRSTLLDRYFVSTEDREIAEISRHYGAEVVDRPASLAGDYTLVIEVLQEILTHIEADVIVILQCTSPVREPDLIDRCIRTYQKSGADCLATGYMSNSYKWGSYTGRRQDFKHHFRFDGSVLVVNADNIRNGDLYGGKRCKFMNVREGTFDIDDEFDVWINEQILRKRTKKSGQVLNSETLQSNKDF